MLQGVRSVLAVPLGVGEKVFGIVYADSPLAEGRFTEDHLKVLTTLASVAAIRVQNARLMEQQMERVRGELAFAPCTGHRATASARKLIQILEVFQRARVDQGIDVLHRKTVYDVSYGELG